MCTISAGIKFISADMCICVYVGMYICIAYAYCYLLAFVPPYTIHYGVYANCIYYSLLTGLLYFHNDPGSFAVLTPPQLDLAAVTREFLLITQ